MNGLRHGYGKEKMPDGEWYQGNFEDDNRNGIGTSHRGDTTISISGEWKDNMQHGLCKTVSSNGAMSIAYQSYGLLHLNKIMYLSNSSGGYFTGIKVADGLLGHVTKTDREGAVFNGSLRNSKRNGHGQTIKKDGT